MNDSRLTIKVGFGKAVLRTSTTSFSAMRVTAPWVRDAAVSTGIRSRGTAVHLDVGRNNGINGNLYGDEVTHESGTIIMLTASRSIKGSPISDGAILLRLRQGAAYLNISGFLPTGPDNYCGDRFAMFQGNADIMSVEEVELLGIRVPHGYVQKFFDPEQIAECFDVVELRPAMAAKPEIVAVMTPSGVKIQEVAAAPSRRMRLRGR